MLRTNARFFWSNRTVAMVESAGGRPLTPSPFCGSDFPQDGNAGSQYLGFSEPFRKLSGLSVEMQDQRRNR